MKLFAKAAELLSGNSKVTCPRYGSVEVDTCAGCSFLHASEFNCTQMISALDPTDREFLTVRRSPYSFYQPGSGEFRL